jgi:hypothetical protein
MATGALGTEAWKLWQLALAACYGDRTEWHRAARRLSPPGSRVACLHFQSLCPGPHLPSSIALLRRRSALGSGSTQSRYLADLRERYGGIDSVLVTGSGRRQAADTASAAAKCR